jgi:hypothetical protein
MLSPKEFTNIGSIMTTLVQLAVGLMDTDSWISLPCRFTDRVFDLRFTGHQHAHVRLASPDTI